ncbi:hypothetical protein JCM10207_005776 [Rhodosporidiobolus poonsookiae]
MRSALINSRRPPPPYYGTLDEYSSPPTPSEHDSPLTRDCTTRPLLILSGLFFLALCLAFLVHHFLFRRSTLVDLRAPRIDDLAAVKEWVGVLERQVYELQRRLRALKR